MHAVCFTKAPALLIPSSAENRESHPHQRKVICACGTLHLHTVCSLLQYCHTDHGSRIAIISTPLLI